MTLEERRTVISLTEKYIRDSAAPRPEKTWLDRKCLRFMNDYHIENRAELDRVLYTRIFEREPDSSGILKVRYWRTGRHNPSNRAWCIRFADALMLNAEEKLFMIQNYFERCDEVFTGEAVRSFRKEHGELPDGELQDGELSDGKLSGGELQDGNACCREKYLKRMKLLDSITEEYLERIHPSRLIQAGIAPQNVKNNFRHLYYTDSFRYICQDNHVLRHSDSASYDHEIRRIMRIEGEIPRRTLLRHLIILMNPFLNRKLLSERLSAFGCCSLSPDHSGLHGERADALILELLELYEHTCEGKDPLTCSDWVGDALRTVDEYLVKGGHETLRFMFFKAQRRG